MSSNSRDNFKVWVPLFFSLVMVSGMIVGFSLRDSLRNKRNITTVIDQNDQLEEIIDLVNEKYVDTVNTDALHRDGINGILRSLDPHTVYIPADELQGINDELEGGFSGIGVEFSILRDTIQIISVIDNGPASRAGIEIGDQIIKVGDSVIAGKNLPTDRIVHMLKGKQKSNVMVSVLHGPERKMKQYTLVRDIIPTYSVDASIMLDSITGFIKINRFSATTYHEFSKALTTLKGQGAKQLILDLRDNPGGYLDDAIAIADELLDDTKLIVYTKGEHAPKTEYKSSPKGAFESGRLAILVDEGSASASEVVAGAIQDWDRGIVAGRRSFGKGLVQEQYEMQDGSALRLTIAKYYTPSGRCIQRSFAKGREAYREDFEKRFESGELTGKDTMLPADTVKYYTYNRRVVYGGGGIKPDVYVPYDTARLSSALLSIVFGQELKTVIWDYFIQNRQRLKFKDVADYERSFNEQKVIEDKYLALLPADARKETDKELARPAAYEYFRAQVKAQLARILFRDNGYYALNAQDDEVVKRALEVLNSNQYSKIISGK
jgi:carboxyl-terminal processing protease